MPKYRITAPDGKSYEVNAPDGATQEQVLAYAQQHYQQPEAAPKEWQPTHRSNEDLHALAGKVDVTEGMSFPAQYAAGWGKSYHDTYNGLRQIHASAADWMLGGNRSEAIQPEVDDAARIDASLAGAPGGKAGRYGGGIVQVAAPMTNAGKLVTWTGKGAQALQGAVGGAQYAAMQPTVTGESRAVNTVEGGALGAGGAVVAPIIARTGTKWLGALSDETRALYEAAKARGINLTPAQLSDSRFVKYLASKLQSLPFSGAAKVSAEQRAAFNQQLAKDVGSDAPALNPAEYANVKAMHSKQFEALTSRNNMRVSPELMTRLQAIEKEAGVSPEAAQSVRAAINHFIEQAQTGSNGVFLPGKAYQALDSALGQVTKKGGVEAHFVGRMKGALGEAMEAGIWPKDKAAWDLLRRQYGNRKTVRDLVGEQDISPAKLMGRVRATNAGKEAMATDRAPLGDLARIGQKIKEPPSSGTPEGQLALDALNPLKWPGLGLQSLVGATVGRIPNSPSLAALAANKAPGRTLEGLARLVEKLHLEKQLPVAAFTLPAQRMPAKKPEKEKKKP